MKFPNRVSKPSKLNNTYIFRRAMGNKILNPIIQVDKLLNASSRSDFRLRKSPNRTSFIVWATLELPTKQKLKLSFLHSLEVWTRAPNPEESKKSILDKSITNGSWIFLRLFVIKFLNCFSENESNCPLIVKRIIFFFISMFPLRETVSFWKSSMIESLLKLIMY